MNLVDLNSQDEILFAGRGGHTDKNTTHSYLPLYDNLLLPIRKTTKSALEIGVAHGGSIKLWHDYFTNAIIYGCDIEDRIVINDLKNNDKVILNLSENAYTEHYVKNNFKDKNMKFDFMLDDGPHSLESQIAFIKLYLPLLSDNGILIIEDIQRPEYIDKLKNITPKNFKQYIKIYDLRKNKGRYDDIVFTIDKVIR